MQVCARQEGIVQGFGSGACSRGKSHLRCLGLGSFIVSRGAEDRVRGDSEDGVTDGTCREPLVSGDQA